MQHKYPFVVFNLSIKPELLDINVHPTKMELRFRNSQEVYEFIKDSITKTLGHKELIPEIELKEIDKKPLPIENAHQKPSYRIPEPFETKRMEEIREYTGGYTANLKPPSSPKKEEEKVPEQLNLPVQLLSEEAKPQHKIIGQLFQTYWLVELQDKFLKQNIKSFEKIGFTVEPFGGREYAVSAVPYNLFGLVSKEVFLEMLDHLLEEGKGNTQTLLLEQIASMSCKTAVKGNFSLSTEEAKSLIDQLLTLENPYHCPHGRPTIIAMTKTEIERKFKRIL